MATANRYLPVATKYWSGLVGAYGPTLSDIKLASADKVKGISMLGIYQAAELYHYAFGFRDTNAEAAVLIAASDQFGNAGRQFLEIACGNCPYAEALMRAGATYHGLDLSSEMLTFSQARLAAAGFSLDSNLHMADMRNFAISHQFDLAFVLMGSLQYLTNDEFLRHLDRVHEHLNPDGLYILEWCVEYETTVDTQSSWREPSPLGEIGVLYSRQQRSALQQSFNEQIEFIVNGELVASTTDVVYLRYPNEFTLLLQSRDPQWEIIGHYNQWNLDTPLKNADVINRPLCILKRNAG
ncbi:MAG: class I SAM-dependent methyltransferase [Caldilineaceae bacterium]